MIFGSFGKFWIDIGVQKNFEIFFSRWKIFLEKYVFGNFGKFWENLKILLGFPFITRYKGNHRNPNRILRFFKNFPNFSKTYFSRKFFHLEKKSRNFSGHLCRSGIFQRIQKSYFFFYAGATRSRLSPDLWLFIRLTVFMSTFLQVGPRYVGCARRRGGKCKLSESVKVQPGPSYHKLHLHTIYDGFGF